MGPKTDSERLAVIEEKVDAMSAKLDAVCDRFSEDHDELIRVKTTLNNTRWALVVLLPGVSALIAWLFNMLGA